jgi:NADH-quinone oxidoreductase subunit J
METTIFYIISFVILVFSVLTVTTNKILRAAVYLLFTLVATSAFYFMVEYNFLAAVQLTLYAGGIVVLIIFSILLTHQINLDLKKISTIKIISSALAVLFGVVLVGDIIYHHTFTSSSLEISDTSVNAIGRQLLSYGKGGYILPFEVISILLLASMISAIIIVKKKQND